MLDVSPVNLRSFTTLTLRNARGNENCPWCIPLLYIACQSCTSHSLAWRRKHLVLCRRLNAMSYDDPVTAAADTQCCVAIRPTSTMLHHNTIAVDRTPIVHIAFTSMETQASGT